jgi:hypothetical protein
MGDPSVVSWSGGHADGLDRGIGVSCLTGVGWAKRRVNFDVVRGMR